MKLVHFHGGSRCSQSQTLEGYHGLREQHCVYMSVVYVCMYNLKEGKAVMCALQCNESCVCTID